MVLMTSRQRVVIHTSQLLPRDLLMGLAMAVAGTAWLSWLHPADVSSGLLTAVAVAVPCAFAIVLLVLPVTVLRLRLAEDAGTNVPVAVLQCAGLTAAAIAAGNALSDMLTGRAAPGLGTLTSMFNDASTLIVVLLPLAGVTLALRPGQPGPVRSPRRTGLVVGLALAMPAALGGIGPASHATAATVTAADDCLAGGPIDKSFNVTSLDVDIPVNRFGDHDPAGKMYTLTSRIAAVRAEEASQHVSLGLGDDQIQPLVIPANEGDCIPVTNTNGATGGDFGLHIDGVEYDSASSGDALGTNVSSAVPQGTSKTYRFAIPDDPRAEGGHYIRPGPGYRAAVNHGLFGALMIEPPGSTYWNTTTRNQPLLSGWDAIIKPTGPGVACNPRSQAQTCAFREAALLHHEIGNDNEVVTDKNGALVPILDPISGSYRPGSFALNYRSEPFRNRLLKFKKEKAHAYSSYTFGDPATPIMRGYLADPTKIRIMHAGGEKFHIFHLHGGGDRWRFNPVSDPTFNYADTGLRKDPVTPLSPSQRLDSQSIGPGESYDLEIEGGAGGVQQSVGDFLYHCHIAKHYVSGMWGMWRVYDTRQGDLVPLWDRTAPPSAVDSRGLIGRTINGTAITAQNLDAWIRPQLPPAGIRRGGQDPAVWNWKSARTTVAPVSLGAPRNLTAFPGSVLKVPGQPNLLPVDAGHIVTNRPTILFNPLNGRPAYPLLRSSIGNRPPFTAQGHSGTPYLGDTAGKAAVGATDPFARRADGLCPSGRNLRKYNVVAIGKEIQRTPTTTDPEGKLFVLAHDKAATYADPAKSDPLAIRANVGDCVGITLTNEIPDASAFDGVSKVEMHIHHVQFDVQGSDGVSTGYAYEHSVRPYQVEDPTLTSAAAHGTTVLHLSDVTKFVGTDANGKPTRPWIAAGEGTESIDIHQIASVNQVAKTVTLATKLTYDHPAGQFAGDEFVQYRWYPDAVLDNIFWYDHVDGIHGWGHGLVGQLIVEPKGSTYHDPVTGAQVDSGTLVDIHTSSPLSPGLVSGSFRELALWTINDNARADYSTLNLKANPLAGRPDKPNQFSSYTYGDPVTPLPRLYEKDPLVVRTISISPTLDTLHFQGARTLLEPRYTHPDANGNPEPAGTVIDTVHSGISEKFTLIFNGEQPEMRMRPGDYLYGNGSEFRLQQGAWGITRILPGTVSDLQPLPGVPAPTGSYVQPAPTGGSPPAAAAPGDPCPTGAPTRSFNLSAMDRSGAYNGARRACVRSVDVAAIKARTMALTPLVLHVVAGEGMTVHLTNLLTTPVGFSVAKLDRTEGSGGVNVGFAPDQNVAPNATRTYTYYVPTDRLGTAMIADLAGTSRDKAGLYGAVVVAPASKVAGLSTEFSDPVTGRARDVGAQVIVHAPGNTPEDYRDFTVAIADDDLNIGQDFMPYPTNANAGRALINYQEAPSGDSFTDSGAVPTLTAYAGDPMVVHAFVAPGSENSHSFSLGGMLWADDPPITDSDWQTTQGLGAWESFNADIEGGAGGLQHQPGDYFYGDLRRPFTEIGVWGLQHVLPAGTTSCPIRRVNGDLC